MKNCFRNLGKNLGFLGDLKALDFKCAEHVCSVALCNKSVAGSILFSMLANTLSTAIFFYVGILFHPCHVSTAIFYVCSYFIPLCSCSL